MDESTPDAPSSSVVKSESGALQLDGLAADETTESDALTQIIHGVEVDVRAVYMAFEQFTEAELIYLLVSQCGLSTDFIMDNCKNTEQMIDWLIQNLPEDMLKSFSLQISLFEERDPDENVTAGAASSSSTSLDIPVVPQPNRINTSPWYRRKMLHALQYNLLAPTAISKLEDRLGCHALLVVPADLKTQVWEYICKQQKLHTSIVPAWLEDRLAGGDQVMSFHGTYGSDAKSFAGIIEEFIKDNRGYRPPPIHLPTNLRWIKPSLKPQQKSLRNI